MVGMNQWNVRGGLRTAHGDLPHFDLHVEGDNVEAADFGVPAGNALNLGDHPPPHICLERTRCGVPEGRKQTKQTYSTRDQQILPTPARPRGRLGHRVCSPSATEPPEPGMLTLLSERSDCSQETSSSLTFSCVSSSRILLETSAKATSPAPFCFNCGTNFSR